MITGVASTSVTLTSTLTQGRTSLHAHLWVYYNDGTPRKGVYDDMDIMLMGPEYDYQLVVDNLNQISRNLAYYASTTLRFHVQDRNGNPIDTNTLSWELRSDTYQYEQILQRDGSGSFTSENSYAATSTLKNKNTKWDPKTVDLYLCLMMQGEASPIDIVEIPTITLQPQVVLELVQPAPNTPGNRDYSGEFANQSGTLTVVLRSNKDWTATANHYSDGFVIKSGNTDVETFVGTSGTSSADTKELVIAYPKNDSTEREKIGIYMFRCEGGGYFSIEICVTKAQPYLKISENYTHDQGYRLPADILLDAYVIPLDTNVSNFKILYNGSETAPDWLTAYTIENVGEISLVLGSRQANPGASTRPSSGFIDVVMQYYNEDLEQYVDWSDSIVHCTQSGRPQAKFILSFHGEQQWWVSENEPVQVYNNTVDCEGAGGNDAWVMGISGVTESNANFTTANWKISGNGSLDRPGSGANPWIPMSDEEEHNGWNGHNVRINIKPNTTPASASTTVTIFEAGQGGKIYWTGTWTQDAYVEPTPDSFDVVARHTGHYVEYSGTMYVGSEGLPANTEIVFSLYRTEAQARAGDAGLRVNYDSYLVGDGVNRLAPNDVIQLGGFQGAWVEGMEPESGYENYYFRIEFGSAVTIISYSDFVD